MEVRIDQGHLRLEHQLTFANWPQAEIFYLHLILKVTQGLDSILTLSRGAEGGKIFLVKVVEGLDFQNDLATLQKFAEQ